MHPTLRKDPLFYKKTPPFYTVFTKAPPISFPAYGPGGCRVSNYFDGDVTLFRPSPATGRTGYRESRLSLRSADDEYPARDRPTRRFVSQWRRWACQAQWGRGERRTERRQRRVGYILYKKLSYRRRTARCIVSVEISPISTQQCRNYLYDKS